MGERQIVEKTIRPDGSHERIEICLGGVVHVISLEKSEEIARKILSLLGIEVAQVESENERLRSAGARLLSVLPDSSVAHENPDCWEWCWNELDGEGQDEVKKARDLWKQALEGV